MHVARIPTDDRPLELSSSKKDLSSIAKKLDKAVQQQRADHSGDQDPSVVAVIERRTFSRAALCTLLDSLLEDATVVPLPDPEGLDAGPTAARPGIVLMSIGARAILDAEVVRNLSAVRAAAPQAVLIVIGDLHHAEQWAGTESEGVDAYIPSDSDPVLLAQAIRLAQYRCHARHDTAEAGRTPAPATPPTSAQNEAFDEPAHLGAAVPLPAVARPRVHLTPREQQVIACLGRGLQNKLIAHELALCESTVKVHVRNILKKLNLSSRTQAALLARDLGIASTTARAPSGETVPRR